MFDVSALIQDTAQIRVSKTNLVYVCSGERERKKESKTQIAIGFWIFTLKKPFFNFARSKSLGDCDEFVFGVLAHLRFQCSSSHMLH